MSKHISFICTPLYGVLEDACEILADNSGRMLSNMSAEYILYSTFLKMTGAQEQKLKCICWEVATDNYEFRYKWQSGQFSIGECSRLEDKQKVLNMLFELVREKDHSFTISDTDKIEIVNQSIGHVERFMNASMIQHTMDRVHQDEFKLWKSTFDAIRSYPACILAISGNALKLSVKRDNCPTSFKGATTYGIDELYQLQYNHRNRCAHNTTSYQETDMALFRNLGSVDLYRYNYLIFFTLLLIIDDITIRLFKKYLEICIEE